MNFKKYTVLPALAIIALSGGLLVTHAQAQTESGNTEATPVTITVDDNTFNMQRMDKTRFREHRAEHKEALLQFLGLSQQEMREARQADGDDLLFTWVPLVDIAGEQGISEEELTEFFTSKVTSRLNEKLAEGVISQEQYDTYLELAEKRGFFEKEKRKSVGVKF